MRRVWRWVLDPGWSGYDLLIELPAPRTNIKGRLPLEGQSSFDLNAVFTV